jgi:hypothetical protein
MAGWLDRGISMTDTPALARDERAESPTPEERALQWYANAQSIVAIPSTDVPLLGLFAREIISLRKEHDEANERAKRWMAELNPDAFAGIPRSEPTDVPEEIARIRFAAETCEAAGRDENGSTPEWFRAGFLAEEVAPRLRKYADLLAATDVPGTLSDEERAHLAQIAAAYELSARYGDAGAQAKWKLLDRLSLASRSGAEPARAPVEAGEAERGDAHV